MSKVLDIRSALLARRLTDAGMPSGDARYLVSALSLMDTNAARFSVLREATRPLRIGATETREWLRGAGLWAPDEHCAREGCAREIHARMALVIVKSRGYCSPLCACIALGVPA